MPSKRMVPEQESGQPDDCLPDCMMPDGEEACAGYRRARNEIAALRDSRDIQQALAQRYWDDLQTARNEIAALTKERDAMKAVVEAARILLRDETGWDKLADALAALDTP